MLHTVAELCEYRVGDVGRLLRNKVNPDALGAYELDDLLDLVAQCLGSAVEEQVRLVKEEYELRFFKITGVGQLLEQFRKQPEHEGGVKQR